MCVGEREIERERYTGYFQFEICFCLGRQGFFEGRGSCCGLYLKVHQRAHALSLSLSLSGVKPHICEHCGRSFTQRSTLTLRKRYCTGQKPYQCGVCNKCFVWKTLVRTHQKSHDCGQNILHWMKNSNWTNSCGCNVITSPVYNHSIATCKYFGQACKTDTCIL